METMSSSGLELSDLTRESFQSTIDKISDGASSILSLTLQWKQVENLYGSIGKSIDERFRQLHSIEEAIRQTHGELKLREEKLSREQDAINLRFEELKRKDKELELMRRSQTSQKEIDRLQCLLEELDEAKLGFEEWLRKLDLEEKKLFLRAQERFEHEAKLERKEKELEAREKRFKELAKEHGFIEEFQETGSSKSSGKRSSSTAFGEPGTPCTRSKSRILRQCGLIQNLIGKEHRLQAIKYVCEFNMADKFSLATLLQDHLRHLKRTSRECKLKDDSVPSQMVAFTKEIADLKAVIKCIQLYKLEADFPFDKIEKSIRKREKRKVELEKLGPCTRSRSKMYQQSEENSGVICTAKETHLEQEHRNKRTRNT